MRKSLCLWVLFCTAGVAAKLFGQILDPIPEPVVKSGLAVGIEDVLQIPPSSEASPRARINMLRSAGDNSGRLFVNDLRDKLHLIIGNEVSTYLDLRALRENLVASPGLGTGFASFAFHPDFATNGIFYTAHTESAGAGVPDFVGPTTVVPFIQGVITEWTASDPSANEFSGASREILRIEFPHFFHGIQEIAFNPNAIPESADFGMLYICVGDGGSVFEGLTENSHRLDSVLGTVLRIDPAGDDGRNGQYGIPADNPWASDGNPETLGEIWAYGFRNPHRISWDSGDGGKMLIGDIGEDNIEEVNLGIAGADYGWNVREGTFLLNPSDPGVVFSLPKGDSSLGYTYPVAQYDHSEGRAIVGGFVYRGSKVPQLKGKYIFGDIVLGRVFYVEVDDLSLGRQAKIDELTLTRNGSEVTLLELVNNTRTDLRFGLDPQGNLYILTKVDGMLRKLVCAAEMTPDLCESGPFFLRGDGNADGTLDISDAIFILLYQFAGTTMPSCDKTADTNDDGGIDLSDAIYLLAYLFLMGPLPEPPFPACGVDATADGLSCEVYPFCGQPAEG